MPTIFRQKVTSNGVTFNDSAAQPANAQSWGLDVMDGWKDTPEPIEISTELGSNRDGVSAGDWFPIRKRYVIVGGYVKAPTPALAETLHDILVRDAFPRNRDLVVQRYESVPKQITCRRSGPVQTEWVMNDGFRWQTTLMAEDPLKYSVVTSSATGGVAGLATSAGLTFPVTFPVTLTGGGSGSTAGSIGVINSGTAPSARFTATLTGYLDKGAWRLRNDTTGEEIRYNVRLNTGDTLVIDFASETALLNGYPITASRGGTYFKLVPGNNTLRLYAEYDPNASVTVVASSAWE